MHTEYSRILLKVIIIVTMYNYKVIFLTILHRNYIKITQNVLRYFYNMIPIAVKDKFMTTMI